MPESRDRRSTTVDIAALFARRRDSHHDELDSALFGSPRRQTPASALASGGFGTPRTGAVRAPAAVENSNPSRSGGRRTVGRGRGRGRGGSSRSLLPSWYPRTPLRDITYVVRAIERRRARLGESDGQQTGNPFPADQLLPDPSASSDNAQLSEITPKPAASGVKLRTPRGKFPKILLDIANQTEGEQSELTPQKKLLNSIDSVEKVVKEELQRLKRTPSAKKAEREKRVRTLMSMR
ncbi:negative regulation of ubiquitin-protein transferase [Stylosanthes scabra]|uniref:Negative regulation of ubiquitin-protein transferase n=1 Tax=Stylosanthes scabra TaxID=79078 RepID=A0ABU6U9V9_9FABA|nr:negative regulation of ubiquitin-protein transferase [Stylosanthes scabra]